ncbi:MAG TPA: YaiI/YqxD family protein [Stenomitos sp.]
MRLIVDGDACPVKDLLLRAALRLQVPLILVSNRPMAFGNEPGVTPVIVPEGPDQADRWIATEATPADLVITADIPLAAAVVEQGGLALGHRGEVFDAASIGEYKSRWTLMATLRNEGLEVGGPKAFSNKDRAAFANAFEQLIRRLQKQR